MTIVNMVGGGGDPELQAKTIAPAASEITVTADEGYEGLSSVTVKGIVGSYRPTITTSTNSSSVINSVYLSENNFNFSDKRTSYYPTKCTGRFTLTDGYVNTASFDVTTDRDSYASSNSRYTGGPSADNVKAFLDNFFASANFYDGNFSISIKYPALNSIGVKTFTGNKSGSVITYENLSGITCIRLLGSSAKYCISNFEYT